MGGAPGLLVLILFLEGEGLGGCSFLNCLYEMSVGRRSGGFEREEETSAKWRQTYWVFHPLMIAWDVAPIVRDEQHLWT